MHSSGIMCSPRSWFIISIAVCAGQLVGGGQVFGAARIEDARLFRSRRWLRAEIRGLDLLDPATTSTIESGYPGTCAYYVFLEDRAGRIVSEQHILRSLSRELWEIRYVLEDPDGARMFPGLAVADSAISHLPSCAVCPVTRLRSGEEYRLVVVIDVRPIGPEDRRHFSGYLTHDNSSENEDAPVNLGAMLTRVFGTPQESERVIRHVGPFIRVADLPEEP